MNKRQRLSVLGLLMGCMAYAATITGRVTDTNGNAMSFVTISVLKTDSTLLTGTNE